MISINNKSPLFLEACKKDENDQLNHFKDKFHIPIFKKKKNYIYFAGNSLGLQPKNAEKYILEELNEWKTLGVEGHLESNRPWLSYHEQLTPFSAEIVGALNKEVVVMNSLTVNLHLLMISFYQPKGKRKKILIEKQAFPSDRYAVQSQLKSKGNHPIDDLLLLDPDESNTVSMNQITNCLEKYGEEIALILLGGVNYYTGQVFDINKITKMAHNYGCLVGIDLAHAAGNIDLHLHDWNVDFASWCGYKYLNGGPGAPSGVFVHEKHLERKDIIRLEGWWGHNKSNRFNMPNKFDPIKSVEAWQLSNPPILAMAPLLASLTIFHEAGIKNLRKKSEELTSFLEFLIQNEMENKVEIITPSRINKRGCQLSLRLLNCTNNIISILRDKGIICDWREPDVLRIAPVPLYNSFLDCYQFVQILKKI